MSPLDAYVDIAKGFNPAKALATKASTLGGAFRGVRKPRLVRPSEERSLPRPTRSGPGKRA